VTQIDAPLAFATEKDMVSSISDDYSNEFSLFTLSSSLLFGVARTGPLLSRKRIDDGVNQDLIDRSNDLSTEFSMNLVIYKHWIQCETQSDKRRSDVCRHHNSKPPCKSKHTGI